MKRIIVKSENEMLELGKNFAKTVCGGDVILLSGDLGVGKTVFTKGFCLGLNISELVTSPTFSIMNEYQGEKLKCFHYDFYRIIDENEAEELGLMENFENEQGVCVVEWSENIASYIPQNAKKIEIIRIDNNSREVVFH